MGQKNNPFCWLWQLSEPWLAPTAGNLKPELSSLKIKMVITKDQTKASFNINSVHVSLVLFIERTSGNFSGWISIMKMLDFLNPGPNTAPQL